MIDSNRGVEEHNLMGTDSQTCVGIDDIAIHFQRLYMDMKDFAELRGADFGKLNKGLGLEAMAIPDVHEDTAKMGAMEIGRASCRERV